MAMFYSDEFIFGCQQVRVKIADEFWQRELDLGERSSEQAQTVGMTSHFGAEFLCQCWFYGI